MPNEFKQVTVPDMGGAEDVAVIEILVKPGDTVTVDQSLITLEGDKATMDVPSPYAGVVKELQVKVGDKIKEGTHILKLSSEESPKEKQPPSSQAPVAEPKADTAQPKTQSAQTDQDVSSAESETAHASLSATDYRITDQTYREEAATSSGGDSSDIHAGPAVRRIAREFGIDLAKIQGSGPKHRILKEDVQSYVKSSLTLVGSGQAGLTGGMPRISPPPQVNFSKWGEIEEQPLSKIKKASGSHLTRNWVTIPHVTQFGEADVTALESFRQSQKKAAQEYGVRLTPLVFIAKAIVSALKKFPSFNASLSADGERLILKKYFNIGVAVDTPNGLVVPILREVDKKGMMQLAKELGVLSEKARSPQGLQLKDMQGGCFTISSLGGIGGTAFTPIINAPEIAILGLSKMAWKPVCNETEVIGNRLMLPLSLSYDHRVIDGAEAARFIVYLADCLSDIRTLLL